MKRGIMVLLFTIILGTTVSAIGSGIIVPQPFVNVSTEVEYTKQIAVFVIGFDIAPEPRIEFKGDNADWFSYEVTDISGYLTNNGQQAWKYKVNLNLYVPKKTKAGVYNGTVTGLVCPLTSGSDVYINGIGICVGASARTSVEVVRKDNGKHKGWDK